MYVASGNRFFVEGICFNSGELLPEQFVKRLKDGGKLDLYLKKGRLSKQSPDLDPVVDKKTGSAHMKKVSVPKKEPTAVPSDKK